MYILNLPYQKHTKLLNQSNGMIFRGIKYHQESSKSSSKETYHCYNRGPPHKCKVKGNLLLKLDKFVMIGSHTKDCKCLSDEELYVYFMDYGKNLRIMVYFNKRDVLNFWLHLILFVTDVKLWSVLLI